jgi:hypothetical protein
MLNVVGPPFAAIRFPMREPMVTRAEGDQVLGVVAASMSCRDDVMHLQLLAYAADRAAVAIPSNNSCAELLPFVLAELRT